MSLRDPYFEQSDNQVIPRRLQRKQSGIYPNVIFSMPVVVHTTTVKKLLYNLLLRQSIAELILIF